jgi:hypothetical protein
MNEDDFTPDNIVEFKLNNWNFHGEAPPEPTAWLVKGLLPESGCGLMSGQWGSYKTTVALDLAVSVMTGTPFAGKFTVRRRGGVCYFAVEGIGGLASRLSAIANARGADDALPFAYRSDCPALTAKDALSQLTIMVESAANTFREKFDLPLVAVFIDTLVTAADYAKAGDENDAAAGQRIMSGLTGLSQRTGALVVGLDHFGKVVETGTRGSSAKEGAADVVLALLAEREISGSVNNTRLAVRKMREGIAGLELPFIPRAVEVGTDLDGDPITRTVIDWDAPPTEPQSSEKAWSKSLQLLRRILMAMLADHGFEAMPFLDGPTVRAVNTDLVRNEFYRQYPADGDEAQKTEARRKAFYRAFKDALAKKLVGSREVDGVQLVWLAT